MAFKKYRKYRKNYRRKAAGVKALKKVNRLARLVKPEQKYDLSYNAGSFVDYNGYTTALMTNNQGVTNAQHVGDRLTLTSLDFRMALYQGGAGYYSTTRCIIYIDKANISPGNNIWSITGSVQAPLAPLSRAYAKDMIVLKDFTIDQTSGGDSGAVHKHFRIPLKGRTMLFNANTNTVMASQLRIAFISTVAPAGTRPEVWWNAEVKYTDC